MDVVILDIYMLYSLVVLWVFNKGQSALVIAIHLYRLSWTVREELPLTKFKEQSTEPDSLFGSRAECNIFSFECQS